MPDSSSPFKSEPGPPTKSGQPIWRTQHRQHTYTSKLLETLRRPQSTVSATRAVRGAADRALAVSARGKTRWSRAILARIANKHKKAPNKPASTGLGIRKPVVHKKPKNATPPPPVIRKVMALSRLVPGCRNLSLSKLLEETADYIPALEMQVKAMAFLAGLLTGGVSTSTSTSTAVGGGGASDRDREFNSGS